MHVFRHLFLLPVFYPLGSLANVISVDGISIAASSMERDYEKGTIELEGKIQVVFHGQHLIADHVTVFQKKKEFEATGHVSFTTTTAHIGAEKVVMNYETNIGTIFHGFIESGQVLFEGELIQKTGEDAYTAIDSEYTSCTTCPAAWSFYGHSISAELNGYALIKNSTLKFGGVPVFWLPYLIVPLKSTRQTGLLTPQFGQSSRSGLSVGQPFYWAIDQDQDATITLQNIELRGLKTLVNYRYALDERSDAELNFGTVNDRLFLSEDRLNLFQNHHPDPGLRRWYFKYHHYLVLPEEWISRMEINTASDLQYPLDFSDETRNHGDSAIENRISLSKNWQYNHLSIDTSYYTNLLQSNPLATNNEAVQRLPEIRWAQVDRPLGNTGFFYGINLDYTNFVRNDFAYDDLNNPSADGSGVRYVQAGALCTGPNWEKSPACHKVRDGKFDPSTDLIRSGERFMFEPTISRPFHIGSFFDFVPRMTYQEAHYNFGTSDIRALTRRYLRAELTSSTLFSAVFGNLTEVKASRLKHEVEPEIILTTIPWIDQPHHPFFGFDQTGEIPFFTHQSLNDTDLNGANGVQFDYLDRLYDRSLVTFRINQRWTRKTWVGDQAVYDQFATWRLSQTYDAYQAQHNPNPHPLSDIESLLILRFEHFNTSSTINYFPYQHLTKTSSRFTVVNDGGDYVQVGLTRDYTIADDGSYSTAARTEDYNLQFGTSARHINLITNLVYDANNTTANARHNRIKSWGYAAVLKPPGDCWSIYFSQIRKETGEQVTSLTFDFLFDGTHSTQLSANQLETHGF